MEWNSLHPRAVIPVSIVLAAVLGGPASAQAPAPAEPSGIRIEYREPTNPDHRSIYERLRQRGVLEDYSDFMSPLKLQESLPCRAAMGISLHVMSPVQPGTRRADYREVGANFPLL